MHLPLGGKKNLVDARFVTSRPVTFCSETWLKLHILDLYRIHKSVSL